jgi:hypothetical protein
LARRIQESYARIEELWTYDEFRRRFDDAYQREAAAAATAAAEKAVLAVTATAAGITCGRYVMAGWAPGLGDGHGDALRWRRCWS